MKYRKFTKRRSNREMLGYLTTTNIMSLVVVILFYFLRVGWDFYHNYLYCLTSMFVLVIINLMFISPYFGRLGKYRWRLNQLFEVFSKTISISDQMLFPTVEYAYDSKKDRYIFRFRWMGKVSTETQNEIKHRLSEILFPQNEYELEEPVSTSAYTTFTYSKTAERIFFDASKLDTKIYPRKIKLNEKLFWELDKQAHGSLTGTTGYGKTTMIYYLLFQVAKISEYIYIVDGKRGDLSTLYSAKEIAETTDQIVSLFSNLIKEMDQRFEAIKATTNPRKTAFEIGFKDIFVFIDELAIVVENAKTSDLQNKAENRMNSKNKDWIKLSENNYEVIISSIRMLIFKARQANIHLILASQNFEAALLGSSAVRDNLAMRILLGNPSSVQVNQMGLTKDQIPNVDYSEKGAGVIYLDGLGWVNAREFRSPFVNDRGISPNEILKRYLELGKSDK